MNHSKASLYLLAYLVHLYLKLQVADIIKEDLWPNPIKYFSIVKFFLLLYSDLQPYPHLPDHLFLSSEKLQFYCFRKLMKKNLREKMMKR